MMKFKQSVHFLLIALFVWSIQNIVIPHQHSLSEEKFSCSICQTAEHTELHQQSNFVLVFQENMLLQTREEAEKVTYKRTLTNIFEPTFETLTLYREPSEDIIPLPLGFQATAPPSLS